jgi:hypothetical protein
MGGAAPAEDASGALLFTVAGVARGFSSRLLLLHPVKAKTATRQEPIAIILRKGVHLLQERRSETRNIRACL